MIDKINISKIIKDHVSSLKDYNTGNYSCYDLLLFFGIPLLFTFILVYYNISLSENIISILITAFSIFAALLFNLLILIYDIIQRSKKDVNKLKIKFIKEIYANISFSILVSIVLVFFLLSICFIETNQMWVLLIPLQFVIYYFTLLFLLTLLMILKRIHVLLSKEIEDHL